MVYSTFPPGVFLKQFSYCLTWNAFLSSRSGWGEASRVSGYVITAAFRRRGSANKQDNEKISVLLSFELLIAYKDPFQFH